MKITDIFKNSSNEEKFIKKLGEYNPKELQESAPYKKFERMRQKWGNLDPNENGPFKIYYKILKKGEYVTQKDIDDIMGDPRFSEIKDTKEFKKYISYLQRLKKNKMTENKITKKDINKYEEQYNQFVSSGTIFLKDFKVYKNYFEFVLKNEWIITKQEAEHVSDIAKKSLKK